MIKALDYEGLDLQGLLCSIIAHCVIIPLNLCADIVELLIFVFLLCSSSWYHLKKTQQIASSSQITLYHVG